MNGEQNVTGSLVVNLVTVFRSLFTLVLVRPDCQLVPARVGKVKTMATEKAEDRLGDDSARLADLSLHDFEIDSVDDHQRPAAVHPGCGLEASAQSAIGKAGVVGSVILERPAEHTAIKPFGFGNTGGREFDVIDPAIVLGAAHRNLLKEDGLLDSGHWRVLRLGHFEPPPPSATCFIAGKPKRLAQSVEPAGQRILVAAACQIAGS